jgi:hypothetical protein
VERGVNDEANERLLRAGEEEAMPMHHVHQYEPDGQKNNGDGTITYYLKCACGHRTSQTV